MPGMNKTKRKAGSMELRCEGVVCRNRGRIQYGYRGCMDWWDAGCFAGGFAWRSVADETCKDRLCRCRSCRAAWCGIHASARGGVRMSVGDEMVQRRCRRCQASSRSVVGTPLAPQAANLPFMPAKIDAFLNSCIWSCSCMLAAWQVVVDIDAECNSSTCPYCLRRWQS
jgi:hypothetical protein